MEQASVFIAVPHYGELAPECLSGLVLASQNHKVKIQTNGASLLAHNFNRLWAECQNQRTEKGFTHFAMHHADVSARVNWLDVLLEEMAKHNADVLSVVIPIKDNRGLTSTGLQDPKSRNIRRLTLKEVFDLPVTFGVEDTDEPKHILMVNTGLWIGKLGEWCEEFPGFECRDRVLRLPDGRFVASALSEDWNASGWWHRHGLKVMATRAVAVSHFGRACYGNDTAWGTLVKDPGD
jgi:hypothetical protein